MQKVYEQIGQSQNNQAWHQKGLRCQTFPKHSPKHTQKKKKRASSKYQKSEIISKGKVKIRQGKARQCNVIHRIAIPKIYGSELTQLTDKLQNFMRVRWSICILCVRN